MASGGVLGTRLLKPVLFAAVCAVAGAARAGQSPNASTCSTSPRREPARRDRRDRARARGRTVTRTRLRHAEVRAALHRRDRRRRHARQATPSSTGSSTTNQGSRGHRAQPAPRRCIWGPPTPPSRHFEPPKSCQLIAAGQSRPVSARRSWAAPPRPRSGEVPSALRDIKCRSLELGSQRVLGLCAGLAMCLFRGVTHDWGERLAAGDPRGTEARRHRRTIVVARECSGWYRSGRVLAGGPRTHRNGRCCLSTRDLAGARPHALRLPSGRANGGLRPSSFLRARAWKP